MEVFVLGMHRSGTSALTGLLSMMGLFLGDPDELMPPKPDNPKGFFERESASRIHREILSLQGGTWDVPPLPGLGISAQVLPASLENDLRGEAELLGRHEKWALKDPLLSLLLPWWRPHVKSPKVLLIHRCPQEVADSLHRRDELPLLLGWALWEVYLLAALDHSSDLERHLVGHRELLADPSSVVDRIYRFLNGEAEGLRRPTREEIAEFVDRSLYRSRVARAEGAPYQNDRRAYLLEHLERGEIPVGLGLGDLSADSREALELFRQLRDAQARTVGATAERDAFFETKCRLEEELRCLHAEFSGRFEGLVEERDALFALKNQFEKERDALFETKNQMEGERDELLSLKQEMEVLVSSLRDERDRVGEGLRRLRADRGRLQVRLDGLLGNPVIRAVDAVSRRLARRVEKDD